MKATLFDNYSTDFDYYKDDYMDAYGIKSEDEVTDDNIYNYINDIKYWEWCDLKEDFSEVKFNDDIIAIGDLELWSGIEKGYCELGNNLSDVLDVFSGDYVQLILDNYNLKGVDAHHDGTNCYTFRRWKDGTSDQQKENFLDKIYCGTATSKDISRYTKSLKKDIEDLLYI